MKKENQHFPQMTTICHKSRHFHTPKVYDAKTKSLICQNGLFSTYLSMIRDVLDMYQNRPALTAGSIYSQTAGT